jgi:hypothetical protein
MAPLPQSRKPHRPHEQRSLLPPPQQQQQQQQRERQQQQQQQQQQWLPYPQPPLDPQMESLCSTLGLGPEDAEMLALLAPEALQITSDDLAARWADLQRLLPAPRVALARAAASDPSLLLSPRAAVPARLRAAAAALGLPRRRLLGPRGGELRFRLAARPAGALVARARLVADLLGVDAGGARRVLLECPRLLGRRGAAIRECAEALEQVGRAARLGVRLARSFAPASPRPIVAVTGL